MSCNWGYSLLSCGFGNSQKDTSEKFRSIIPISSTTCQCYDNYGAKCVIQCYAEPVNNFQIVKTPTTGFLTGTVIATCPIGSYVTGCYPNLDQASSSDNYRRYYPSSNQSCTCHETGGIQCIATCATNVRNYEIKTVTSDGTFQVVCSAPNAVLGCGLYPTGSGYEKFKTACVFNTTACQCYDYYGTPCYAICGQLY